ncbi:ABC transporter permease [Ferdinandcohnia quinoae]|uniref:ABC transporter permease n=1 Tax=Fredinandcohnia quinoae TaxID=2918902 RepID=A0AAW5E7L3_9BACI|nr:ABC transporter permease [Fredinandcohnia sp. SECRCQ15]MCH1625600.1 ABC transporter permease [Fredinandcohnia sp. SECRCQ15]
MKSFIIAWKDFTIQFRDRKAFLLMICMPLLLTAILGAALKGVFNSDSSLPKTNVAILQKDDDSITTSFVEEILEGKDLQDTFNVKKVNSQKEIEKMIQSEEMDVGLIFPAKWGEEMTKGDGKSIQIFADPGKELQSSLLESIVRSYQERASTIFVSTNTLMADLVNSQPVTSGSMKMDELGALIVGELQKKANQELGSIIKEEPLGEKSVSSIQYYAAAMAAMFLLFNMMTGAKSIINERTTETLSRLMSTPTSRQTILFGKFLGVFYFAMIQLMIFIVVTHFGFGVYWGDNYLQIIAIGITYGIAVSGLSMLFAAFIKEEKTADVAGGISVQMLALLGGSMLPLAVFPNILNKIANIAPNKWALTSFLDVMGGAGWDSLIVPIIVMMAIGILSVTLGSLRLGAK